MTLRSDMAAHAARVFLNANHFAEEITYTPHNELAVTLNAIVNRSPVRPVEHGGKPLPGNVIEIEIANHATLGRTSIKERFDRVTLPLREGGEDVELVVTKVLEQDPGMWKLEARG